MICKIGLTFLKNDSSLDMSRFPKRAWKGVGERERERERERGGGGEGRQTVRRRLRQIFMDKHKERGDVRNDILPFDESYPIFNFIQFSASMLMLMIREIFGIRLTF